MIINGISVHASASAPPLLLAPFSYRLFGAVFNDGSGLSAPLPTKTRFSSEPGLTYGSFGTMFNSTSWLAEILPRPSKPDGGYDSLINSCQQQIGR